FGQVRLLHPRGRIEVGAARAAGLASPGGTPRYRCTTAATSRRRRSDPNAGVPGSSGVNPQAQPARLVTAPSTPHPYRPPTTRRSDLMPSVSHHHTATADLHALADLARIAGRGTCRADWGLCPDHGNTLTSTGGH